MPALEAPEIIPGFSRIKTGAGIVLRGLEHRAELAALELGELRTQVTAAGTLIAVATAAFYLAGLAATLLVAAIFWDTPHRTGALVWLTSIEVLVGVAAIVWMRRRWRDWRPWSATREQLNRDARCLHQIFQHPQN